MSNRTLVPLRALALVALLLALARPAVAQRGGGPPVVMDSTRARQLYVSNRPEDHPRANYERDIADKARTDSIFEARAAGVLDYRKITFPSRVGDLDIPAYVFQPLEKRGDHGHAALIWVHDGVHNDLNAYYFPFIREAVERGYVVIAPEYRGSTGYGEAFHNAIDYGGYEVDDVDTAFDWLVANLPHVDPERVGIIGWSHGGYITLLSVLKDDHPYRAAAAIVPVTNLIFRLSYKGPGYQPQLRHPATHRRPAVRGARDVHRALALLSRRQARDPLARARHHERQRRQLRGGFDADLGAARAEAGPGGDRDLPGPARRPQLQPHRRPPDAGAAGYARNA